MIRRRKPIARGKPPKRSTKPIASRCVCGHAKSKHDGKGCEVCPSSMLVGSPCYGYRPKPLPKATKRPKARKSDPKKRRFSKLRDPEYVAWIRTLPCTNAGRAEYYDAWVAAGRPADNSDDRRIIEAAHVRSRGAGGADVGNTVPLCRICHREQHRIGIKSFEAKYGVDLKALALELANRYDREVSRDRVVAGPPPTQRFPEGVVPTSTAKEIL